MIKRYFSKWRWILTPYQSRFSANVDEGMNLIYAVEDECKEFDKALFTQEMIHGKLRHRYPELTKQQLHRAIEILIHHGFLLDIGLCRQGASSLRVLQNAK